VFGRLLEHGAVPKLIVLTVCLCGVYVLLRLSVDALDVRRLASGGAFAVYVDGLSALVNATNADVKDAATAYNDVVIPAFSAVIHTQITNLHHLIDHFNHGHCSVLFCSFGQRLRGGATGKAFGLRSVGRGFKSCSRQRCVTTLGKLFTPMCLYHQAV